MRVLEEVCSNAKFAPVDYLRQLWRYLQNQEHEEAANGVANGTGEGKKLEDVKEQQKHGVEAAECKLEIVRLALARNLSRALVVGGDGPF